METVKKKNHWSSGAKGTNRGFLKQQTNPRTAEVGGHSQVILSCTGNLTYGV